MNPFILKINLCISVIALLTSSLTAQATPIDFDIAQSFDDGSTSNFSFTYDPQNYELTNVSSVYIEDADGPITVPLEDVEVYPIDDPDFGSSILVFIFNSLTTNVIEALAYNGQTGSFDEAAASLFDERDFFIEQYWSKSVDDDSNEGGDITINGNPLGFEFSDKQHDHEDDDDSDDDESNPTDELPIASVPEPNIFALLLAGLLGFSLTGQIRKIISGKNTAKSSILAL